MIAQTATRTMDVIERCLATLHDLAAPSPMAAAATLIALRSYDTPAAARIAHLVQLVADARYGTSAIRAAEQEIR
jgi:hypothetical protein